MKKGTRIKKDSQKEELKQFNVLGYDSDVQLLKKYLFEDNSNMSAFFREIVENKIKYYEKQYTKEGKECLN